MNIENLLTKCKEQDIAAQETLYRLFSPKFFVICLKYASSYEQAKDCLHDGFIKIYQNITSYKGKGSFEGWMTRIMINNALREYQNKSVFLEIDDNLITDHDIELEIEPESLSLEFLMKLIQELPTQYRLVFCLYALDGYSHKDISETLKISSGTSKSNLARARLKLKENIESYTQQKLARGL